VSRSPEEELAEFLKPLPAYVQKALWYGAMSQQELLEFTHSTAPFSEGQLREIQQKLGWQPSSPSVNYKTLREEFERILQRCDPSMWETYLENAKAARAQQADMFVSLPRRKRGRKPNDDLAERIWALDDAGKTNREIKETLNADGVNLSLDGVEYYLKSRRRPLTE
jgi:hypothetical protein